MKGGVILPKLNKSLAIIQMKTMIKFAPNTKLSDLKAIIKDTKTIKTFTLLIEEHGDILLSEYLLIFKKLK